MAPTQLAGVRDDVISHRSRTASASASASPRPSCTGPRLLVLDEPIAGLDPVQIVEMRELVQKPAPRAHHHHLEPHPLEISETCDRILVIREGEIVASGTEAELSSRCSRAAAR